MKMKIITNNIYTYGYINYSRKKMEYFLERLYKVIRDLISKKRILYAT